LVLRADQGGRVTSFTSAFDRYAAEEAQVAAKLAAAAGISWHAPPYCAPSQEERKVWFDSTGGHSQRKV
jgi:hypothetical protein